MSFLSIDLAADKLIPVNTRVITSSLKMCQLWLRSNACLQSLLKQFISLFYKWMTLVGTKRLTSIDKCLFKTSTGLPANQMLRQGRSRSAKQAGSKLTWASRKFSNYTSRKLSNFSTNRKEARTPSAIDVTKVSIAERLKFCLAPRTINTSISQQSHSNLGGLRKALYPSLT